MGYFISHSIKEKNPTTLGGGGEKSSSFSRGNFWRVWGEKIAPCVFLIGSVCGNYERVEGISTLQNQRP